MRIHAIIQARTGSTRLKNKVLREVNGYSILRVLCDRLKSIGLINELIIATTEKDEDDPIEIFAKENSIQVYRGSEKNVLDRFFKASQLYQSEIVIRITGDNPVVSRRKIIEHVNCLIHENNDYVSSNDVTLGLNNEVFSFETLKITRIKSSEPYQEEHVTPYIYENPSEFKIKFLEPGDLFNRSDIRLTVDTKEDFELFTRLIEHFGDLSLIGIEEILKFLDENKHIKQLNEGIQQKHYKTYQR